MMKILFILFFWTARLKDSTKMCEITEVKHVIMEINIRQI